MYRCTKYGAKKTIVDGIKFDSKKEAKRYQELKLLEASGRIQDLKMQNKFEIIPQQYEIVGRKKKVLERACYYIADFTYYEDGEFIVEDVKGRRTDVYKIKKKLMLLKGYRIRET